MTTLHQPIRQVFPTVSVVSVLKMVDQRCRAVSTDPMAVCVDSMTFSGLRIVVSAPLSKTGIVFKESTGRTVCV